MGELKDTDWTGKVGNHFQVGGIETSTLENGLGRGTRIAWVNTGSGLRFKVAIDRALDIADAFYDKFSLAWLSHSGVTAPRPESDSGVEWLWSFGGGLITTCGLSHVGPPESDDYGERGLHGRISNIAGQLESIVQPNVVSGSRDMSLTATTKESRVFGPCLELRRTLACKLGESMINISDVVTNVGNRLAPHMLLYHCNFGWPLVDEGTKLVWNGDCQSRGLEMDDEIFNEDCDYRICPGPLESHCGQREACAFIDVTPDLQGHCTVGLHNEKLGLALALTYKKEQLPWLANWQHWGPNEYVTALEPGTNPPIGQGAARKQDQLLHLAPGQSRTYELQIEVLDQEEKIATFLENAS